MTKKTIIIIGGGIAGLSAGCYGQMNGYDTRIYELHSVPGGLCTAWKRQGYTFDGCIHWLVGSSPDNGMHQLWAELGALPGPEIVNHEEFMRIEGAEGKAFIVYTNIDRLEAHMKGLAPGDAHTIDAFISGIRAFTRMPTSMAKPTELMTMWDRLRGLIGVLPVMGALRKWSGINTAAFAARFQDPFLREAFSQFFSLPDFPILGALITLAGMHMGDSGYPVGGSLPFARSIAQRYEDLGGAIRYNARVAEILVENGRAAGVRLSDGSEHRADIVISAADGRATLFDMLHGRYLTDRLREAYDSWPRFRPAVQVSLGVNRDLSGIPRCVTFKPDTPVSIAGEPQTWMSYQHFCHDPTMAPAGKSAIVVHFDADYATWRSLADEGGRGPGSPYATEKEKIATAVIAALSRRMPGLADQVEVIDVATPLTTERFTGNWEGSVEGWLLTTDTMKMMSTGKGLPKTLPGLKDFYMVGQWVEPGGGLPPAAYSGRGAIALQCRADGKPFQTTTP